MEAIVQPKQASTPGGTRLSRAQAIHVRFFRWCTSENMCRLRACARSKHVSFSPEAARLCSAISSMKDHVNTNLFLLGTDEMRAANKQRWCTQA